MGTPITPSPISFGKHTRWCIVLGLDKLTSAVVGLVLMITATGNLHKVTLMVLKAQAQLIQETKASKWGRVPLLPVSN